MNRSGQTPLSGPLAPLPSTPVRAITSTLATRSAPPVPPASQSYEPLVKAVLRRRLFSDVVAPSIGLSWAVTSVTCILIQGGVTKVGLWATVYNLFSPWTLLFATAAWLIGSLPVIVLRHRYLTGE